MSVAREPHAPAHAMPAIPPAEAPKHPAPATIEGHLGAQRRDVFGSSAGPAQPIGHHQAPGGAVSSDSEGEEPAGGDAQAGESAQEGSGDEGAKPSARGGGKGKSPRGGRGGAKAGKYNGRSRPPANSGTLLSMEEEEVHLKPGTSKHAAFMVLKKAGVGGLTPQEIGDQALAQGLKDDWGANGRRHLREILHYDVTFALVSRTPTTYALRAMPGVVAVADEHLDDKTARANMKAAAAATLGPGTVVKLPKAKKPKTADGGSTPGAPATTPRAPPAPPPPGTAAAVAYAENEIKKLHEKIAALLSEQAGLEAGLKAARGELEAEAKRAREPEAVPAAPAPPPVEPSWALPAHLETYRGDRGNEQTLAAWTKAREEAQKKLEACRAEWLEEQAGRREQEARERQRARERVVADAKERVKGVLRAVETKKQEVALARQALGAAENRLAGEKLRVEKSKQREADKEVREKQKAVLAEEKKREAERRDKEKEARAAEAKAARRYPIEDLDRLAEVKARAAEAGLGAPREDVALPALPSVEGQGTHLPTELACLGSWEAAVDVLFVADMISTLGLGKALGVRQFTAAELAALIAGACSRGPGDAGEGESNDPSPLQQSEAAAGLAGLYTALLRAGLTDGGTEGTTRHQRRWAAIVDVAGQGAWPELTRRILLARAAVVDNWGMSVSDLDDAVISVAGTLASNDAGRLSPAQHAALLRWLSDDALDTEGVRGVLGRRLDTSVEAISHQRATLAELRGKLKDLQEVGKEAKRKAAEAKLAATQQDAAVGGEAASGGTDAKAKGPTKARPNKPSSGGAGEEGKERREGSREGSKEPAVGGAERKEGGAAVKSEERFLNSLPPELREYKGDPEDKQALAKFEAARTARLKELEAEAAKNMDKTKQELTESIQGHVEVLEKELEKATVRRPPLGSDRHFRRYWWGVAGMQGVVMVDAGSGAALPGSTGSTEPRLAAVIATPAELTALIASLDTKGVREADLKRALERARPAIEAGMKAALENGDGARPAAAPGSAAASAAVAATLTTLLPALAKAGGGKGASGHSSIPRNTRAHVYDDGDAPVAGSKHSTEPRSGSEDGGLPAPYVCDTLGVDPFQAAGLLSAVGALSQLVKAAVAARVKGPTTVRGWAAYDARLHGLLGGEVPAGWLKQAVADEDEDGTTPPPAPSKLATVLRQLKTRMQELEQLVMARTGEWGLLGPLAAKLREGGTAATEEGEEDGEAQEESEAGQEHQGNGGQQGQPPSTAAAPPEAETNKRGGTRRGGLGRRGRTSESDSRLLDDSPEVVLDDDDVPRDALPPRRRATSVWHSVSERTAWLAALEAAHTTARVAYCAAFLACAAMEPLRLVVKAEEEAEERKHPASGKNQAARKSGRDASPAAPVSESDDEGSGPMDVDTARATDQDESSDDMPLSALSGGVSGAAPALPSSPTDGRVDVWQAAKGARLGKAKVGGKRRRDTDNGMGDVAVGARGPRLRVA